MEYGRTKYQLEQFFLLAGQIVVRPGLVIGDGGLFGRNLQRILTSRVIPMIGGGIDLLPLVSLSDFLSAMQRLLKSREAAGAYNLFNSDLVSMRTLVQRVQAKAGRRALYLPIPARVAVLAMEGLSRLGIQLPSSADNVKALRLNQQPIHQSDLGKLVDRETALDEMLEQLQAFRPGRDRHGRTHPK